MKAYILRFRARDRKNFDAIKKGLKTVETRAASARYRMIQKGDKLVFVCGSARITRAVKQVRHFRSVAALFRKIPLQKVFPALHSIADAQREYFGYPGYREKIREFGIIALEL